MNTKVKICGITNVNDGLAAAHAGADMIGLIFWDESPRHVDIETATRISAALPPEIARVGVFVNPSQELVAEAIYECGINMLQFHGDEPPDFCTRFGLMSVKAFLVRDATSLEPMPTYATDAWLLDAWVPARRGGTGARFNWELAVEAKKLGRPIFLAGGLNPENIKDAVHQVQPFAVDVSSGVEAAPGKKDHGKIAAFINSVQKADRMTA